MQTQCSADLFGFAPVAGRAVVAGFDGGRMTSDAGALPLGITDRSIGLVERFTACSTSGGAPELTEQEIGAIFGIALGYEDLIDHDQLRHDPTMAVLAGKLAARRKGVACRSVPGSAPTAATADNSRPRRHRRPATRASGRPLLSRLL